MISRWRHLLSFSTPSFNISNFQRSTGGDQSIISTQKSPNNDLELGGMTFGRPYLELGVLKYGAPFDETSVLPTVEHTASGGIRGGVSTDTLRGEDSSPLKPTASPTSFAASLKTTVRGGLRGMISTETLREEEPASLIRNMMRMGRRNSIESAVSNAPSNAVIVQKELCISEETLGEHA